MGQATIHRGWITMARATSPATRPAPTPPRRREPDPEEPTFRCRRCGTDRPLARFDFQPRRSGPPIRRQTCKDCYNAARQARVQADGQRRQARNLIARQTYRRLRDRLAGDPAALAAYRATRAADRQRLRDRRKAERA